MRGLVKAEQRLLARFERELIGPSDRSPSGSARVASTYLRVRHQVLYGAIRRRLVWIGSAWKVVLALTLRPGDTFVDVGANIGLVTQPASWLVGRGGRVHSFEPSPSIAACLRRRVTLLKLDNVVVNECALGQAPGTAVLHEHARRHGGMSSLRPTARPGFRHDRETTVAVRSLDEYANEHGLESVRLIKVDVEGSELDVLRGAARLIASQRPVLFVEVSRYTNASFGRSIDELLAAIAALGYTLYSWRRDGLAQIRTADDVPAAWQRDDAICLYLPRHDGLYKQLLALAERRRARP